MGSPAQLGEKGCMASGAGAGRGVDLSNPTDLYATVGNMFTSYAFAGNLHVDPSAIAALVTPGLGGSYQKDLKEVDLKRLDDALHAIFVAISPETRVAGNIDAAAIGEAMRRSRCHYLWFC
jgi:hypothetical protein